MKIIECPRDAWQGHHSFIPTDGKAQYLNLLLQVGFDTLDFGSFVSPKVMPQVRDTAQIIEKLDLSSTATKLLSIVANERGAQAACEFEEIKYLGYPFSISETFQFRNTNATIKTSVERVKAIQELCNKHQKDLVIYISMGFGNSYNDPWSPELALYWVDELAVLGIRTFSLSDTIGVAKEEDIRAIFGELITSRPDLEFGGHFHTKAMDWRTKLHAAYESGCRRFDGAIMGYGGCPMAQDDLVGNMPTERLLEYAKEMNGLTSIDQGVLGEATQFFAKLVG
jgi:hydroxymethylglutaryl-CoA lyase